MQVSLRKINQDDIPVLSRIARQSFYDTFTGTCTEADMQGFLDTYFTEKKLSAELEEKGSHYLFAEADGHPVGYMQFMEDYRSFPFMKKWKALELKRIYVLKEYHGLKIAQTMMDHLLSFAQDNQYEVIWLGVWEHNLRAQQFYAKYGFLFSGHTHDFPIGNTPQTDHWLWKFL